MTTLPRQTEIDPVVAFERRQDARDARRLTHLQSQGYTHSRCACGATYPLDWAGWECNAWADNAEGVCGGRLRAVGGAQ